MIMRENGGEYEKKGAEGIPEFAAEAGCATNPRFAYNEQDPIRPIYEMRPSAMSRSGLKHAFPILEAWCVRTPFLFAEISLIGSFLW